MDKLEALLAKSSNDLPHDAHLISELLSIPASGRYEPLNLSPQKRKERTLHVLFAQLIGLAATQPVLVVVEDAHWIDPTSLELLDLTIAAVQSVPVLMIIISRPDFRPSWSGAPYVTTLVLNRLSRVHSAEIVKEISAGKTLPAEVIDQINSRADGVPLFVEELTKTVLESDLLRDDRALMDAPHAIPSTLYDSLMARIDRLGAGKALVQVGAAIGREFTYQLLAMVVRQPAQELANGLARLLESELISCRGIIPDAKFIFKHALIQDAAYQSLLRGQRQQLHARIAEALERITDNTEPARPEIIAHHLAEAGFVERAIVYLREAAHAATKRWANAEAAGHLTRARELAARHPDAAVSEKAELAVLLELGPVLVTVRGIASGEVEDVYRRAHLLCSDVTEPSQLFAVKWGLWSTEHHHDRFEAARRWADELLNLAQSSGDRSLLLQAHHCAWTSLFVLGENQRALNHAEEGIQLYDINAHREHAARYGGHDPGVCAHMVCGMAAWFAGFPDRAAMMSAKAIELGCTLGDPFSWAMALSFGATVAAMRREPAVVTERSAALQRLLDRHQLALGHFGSTAKILTGWAIALDGRPDEGCSLAEAGLAEIRRSGYARVSFQLSLMAAVYRMAANTPAALKTVDEALQVCQAQGEVRWYSQLLHEKGVLLADATDTEGAEQTLTAALNVARQQQVRSPELRAATRLAQLLSEQGRQREAGDLLRPVYGWFTEGFDTEDLKEARELLAAL